MSLFLKDDRDEQPAAGPSEPTRSYVAVPVSRSAARRRRRTITWAIFGVVGLALGAVWAAGVVTTNSTVGNTTDSPPVLVQPGAAAVDSRFEGVITDGPAPLAITFSGKKGVIAANGRMWDVDLAAADPSTANGDPFSGTYFVSIEVPNGTTIMTTGWQQLSLEMVAVAGTCASNPNFAAPASTGVLHVETSDSSVDLPGLAGGTEYCVGVAATPDASDIDGTFIRKTSGSVTPTQPNFAIYIAQSAT